MNCSISYSCSLVFTCVHSSSTSVHSSSTRVQSCSLCVQLFSLVSMSMFNVNVKWVNLWALLSLNFSFNYCCANSSHMSSDLKWSKKKPRHSRKEETKHHWKPSEKSGAVAIKNWIRTLELVFNMTRCDIQIFIITTTI